MYDELVKTLRLRAALWEKMYDEDSVLKQAADAIEELSAIREEQKEQIIAMAAEDKPRALPDDYDFLVQYEPPQPQTNADRIRAMSDEELADWLGVYCNGQTAQEVGKPCVNGMGSCEECWLDWLKQEAKDD